MSLTYYVYIFCHIFIYNDNIFIQKNHNNIVVLKDYSLTLSMNQLVKNYPYEDFKDFFLYTLFIKGRIEENILYFLLNTQYYILDMFAKRHANICDDEIIELIKIFTRTSIDFSGYEKASQIQEQYLQKNYYICYKIIVLDIKNISLIEQDQYKLPMEQLIQKYCIFKYTQKNTTKRTKKLLFYCPNCSKKEIHDHLLLLKQNEKKIVYIKSLDRYVLLERLENVPVQEIVSPTILRFQYLKYGASIYWRKQNLDEFQKYIYYILHQSLCCI